MKNSITFFILLFCNSIIAQSPANKDAEDSYLESCVENFSYGEKSENYIDFQVDNESRRLYFSKLDAYQNDKGGYNIYLPPFGFDASIHQAILEEAKKHSFLANIFSNNTPQFSEIHIAWTPESTFSSDKISVLKDDLLTGDCFFVKNKKKIKSLLEDISYNYEVDTTKIDDGLIFQLIASEEESKSTIELKLNIKNIKKNPKLSDKDLEEANSMCLGGRSNKTIIYHYTAGNIIKYKEKRSFNYKTLELSGEKTTRIGNPSAKEFSIYELTKIDNSIIIIKEHVLNEEEKFDIDQVYISPLKEGPKEIDEYELNSNNLDHCYISSSLIKITAEPLTISKEMLPQNSKLHEYLKQSRKAEGANIKAAFKTEIALNELPEKQNINSIPDEYYSYWMKGSNGNLYKIKAKEENNVIYYDFYEHPIPEEVIFSHLSNQFSSEEAYLAYAELQQMGEKMSKNATFGDENALKWIKNKLKTADLEELISEKKVEMFKSIGNYVSNNYTEKEKEYIALYYLKNTNNAFEIINGYIKADNHLKEDAFNKSEFLNSIELGLNHFNIEMNDEDPKEILKRLKDAIYEQYGRRSIAIIEDMEHDQKLINTLQIEKQTGNVISLNRQLGNDISLNAHYKKDSLLLETNGATDTKATTYKITENIWDAHQLYVSLPFLPLKEGFEETIYLTDYTNFFTYGKENPVPHIKTKFASVKLKFLDSKKVKIAGEKEKVYELQLTLNNKLEGLPGISKKAEEYKLREDGSLYATVYVDKSYPHQLYSIELKNRKINFMEEGNDELTDWYGRILSK